MVSGDTASSRTVCLLVAGDWSTRGSRRHSRQMAQLRRTGRRIGLPRHRRDYRERSIHSDQPFPARGPKIDDGRAGENSRAVPACGLPISRRPSLRIWPNSAIPCRTGLRRSLPSSASPKKNAITEGFHNKLETINGQAMGFGTFDNRAEPEGRKMANLRFSSPS
jgi:hypothetical protein